MDDDLRARFAACGTLAEAILVGLRAAPPWEVADVVVQDEYTHDVVFQGGPPGATRPDGPALVLDCT